MRALYIIAVGPGDPYGLNILRTLTIQREQNVIYAQSVDQLKERLEGVIFPTNVIMVAHARPGVLALPGTDEITTENVHVLTDILGSGHEGKTLHFASCQVAATHGGHTLLVEIARRTGFDVHASTLDEFASIQRDHMVDMLDTESLRGQNVFYRHTESGDIVLHVPEMDYKYPDFATLTINRLDFVDGIMRYCNAISLKYDVYLQNEEELTTLFNDLFQGQFEISWRAFMAEYKWGVTCLPITKPGDEEAYAMLFYKGNLRIANTADEAGFWKIVALFNAAMVGVWSTLLALTLSDEEFSFDDDKGKLLLVGLGATGSGLAAMSGFNSGPSFHDADTNQDGGISREEALEFNRKHEFNRNPI